MCNGLVQRTLLVCLLLLTASCQTVQSPTGRSQVLMFSEDQMAQIGAQSFEQILKQEKVSQDARLNRYVQCISDAVTAQIPASYPPTNWEVVVFESEQVNAFALPGGHIGVYTGLLEVAENQHQLASVIGHEIAHVLARHSNERLTRGQLTELGLNAAGAAMDVGGIAGRDIWMSALGVGAQVGILLPYDRKQETEADVVGLDLMAKAGFAPRESVTLWLRMGQANKGPKPVELLSTHPSHDRRIDDLNRRMAQAESHYRQAREAGRRPNCRR